MGIPDSPCSDLQERDEPGALWESSWQLGREADTRGKQDRPRGKSAEGFTGEYPGNFPLPDKGPFGVVLKN